MASEHWRVAEFDSAERLRAAILAMQAQGIRVLDTCTPYEVPGLAKALRRHRSRVPRFAFIGGLVGAIVGYTIQWYVDAIDYPLNIGGRPNNAVPSFIFVTFETLVLCSAFAIFFGLFFVLGLPRYYHPLWEIEGFERASIDRFWVVVDGGEAPDPFNGLEPLRVVDLEVNR